LTESERDELRRLRKENPELRRANEILKAASAYFAAELDPTRRRTPRRAASDADGAAGDQHLALAEVDVAPLQLE
jgi:transposase-like protein